MTNTGYQNLLEQIRSIIVEPPDNFTVEQLQAWILGYGACYGEITKLIDSYIDYER